jgi:cell division protein FtsI/penicillin-binding protein 2
VTARSRERGSHAGRPRGYSLPFPVPGIGSSTATRQTKAAERDGAGTQTEAPAHPAAGTPPRSGGSRHRKPAARRSWLSRKQRLGAVFLLVIGAFTVGLANGFGSEASAEPTVQAFLLDWQQGRYAQAAKLTDGDPGQVAAQLAASYTDLDATNAFLAMKMVAQHGKSAEAAFKATVDLAQGGRQWAYTGRFQVVSAGGRWRVHWAPSVIDPDLGPGDRLAVMTTFAPRAPVLDSSGSPLVSASTDYRVGVYPGRLTNSAATAASFAADTGLNAQQVLGQIDSAPPHVFLPLLRLDPDSFHTLWPRLAKIAGLAFQQQKEQLFDSLAEDAVGEVGTENSPALRAEGAAYQPGMTVGLTGLEQTYQDQLAGTPTTEIVVVNPAGQIVATPGVMLGRPGTPVRTTLSGQYQRAAGKALAGQRDSGEIVAVDWRTGAIRVLASRLAGGGALPAGGALNARVQPGMAFSIVSAAALLGTGVGVNHPLPCKPLADVGGVTFAYQPTTSTTATFASDFVSGCGTAFANLSRTLTARQLTAAERAFGLGALWRLPVQAFSGSATAPTGQADVAAQATGARGVLMSPLGMAMVAAEVAAGTGRAPVLLAAGQGASWPTGMSADTLGKLRQLMRQAVKSGSAHSANVPGAKVYGQAGVVQTGQNAYLSWFVGYRGGLAVAVLETGTSATQAAAALAGTFLKNVR